MRRMGLGLLVSVLMWSACGVAQRPCVEDAECFAGEHCTHKGVCAIYKGKTITKPRPGQDMQSPGTPGTDMDNPFRPRPRDMPEDLDEGDLIDQD